MNIFSSKLFETNFILGNFSKCLLFVETLSILRKNFSSSDISEIIFSTSIGPLFPLAGYNNNTRLLNHKNVRNNKG